jgi:phosphoglycolate phosphatase
VATFSAVLFDLDGTLVDTAPDMVAVLDDLQKMEGQVPLPYATARAQVSNGAAGLIHLAFPNADAAQHERLRLQYLERYQEAVCVRSTLFPGLAELLDILDAEQYPWGVVTNKPARMTDPLLAGLGLGLRAACAISGDTLEQRKPHPAPLLLASEKTGVAPERTVYVGDAARDIEAGRAAGMITIAVEYGYISDDDPHSWNADHVVADTAELTKMLLKGFTLDT